LAFEPNPMAFFVLKHLRVSMKAVWAALSRESGDADLVVPITKAGLSSNGAHLRDARMDRSSMIYRVPALSIDSLGLDAVGFLKIDVEGGEPAILDGARETIRRCRPNIMVEHEVSHAGAAFGDVFQRLEALDYEGFFLERCTLRHLSHFDPQRQQGTGTRKSDGSYVGNFFYLPRANLDRAIGMPPRRD